MRILTNRKGGAIPDNFIHLKHTLAPRGDEAIQRRNRIYDRVF